MSQISSLHDILAQAFQLAKAAEFERAALRARSRPGEETWYLNEPRPARDAFIQFLSAQSDVDLRKLHALARAGRGAGENVRRAHDAVVALAASRDAVVRFLLEQERAEHLERGRAAAIAQGLDLDSDWTTVERFGPGESAPPPSPGKVLGRIKPRG